MTPNPYSPPRSQTTPTTSSTDYASYADVPVHRRQWFFWVFWLVFSPISIGILVTGDVYYVKKGEVRSFGMANRVLAGILGVAWLVRWYGWVLGDG